MVLKTAWNSIRLSVLTAIITAVIGILLGYAIVKGRGTRFSRLVEQMAFLPYLMPSIAFGAIYISMFARRLGPIPALYGTYDRDAEADFYVECFPDLLELPVLPQEGSEE